MAEKSYNADDPFTLVDVVIPGEEEDSLVNMACAFVEEFLRMGWPQERILALFRNPFYRGPYAVYRAKGEEWVKALLSQTP